jgi:hypothetical protein
MGSIVSVTTGPSRQAITPGMSDQIHRSPDRPTPCPTTSKPLSTRSTARTNWPKSGGSRRAGGQPAGLGGDRGHCQRRAGHPRAVGRRRLRGCEVLARGAHRGAATTFGMANLELRHWRPPTRVVDVGVLLAPPGLHVRHSALLEDRIAEGDERTTRTAAQCPSPTASIGNPCSRAWKYTPARMAGPSLPSASMTYVTHVPSSNTRAPHHVPEIFRRPAGRTGDRRAVRPRGPSRPACLLSDPDVAEV